MASLRSGLLHSALAAIYATLVCNGAIFGYKYSERARQTTLDASAALGVNNAAMQTPSIILQKCVTSVLTVGATTSVAMLLMAFARTSVHMCIKTPQDERTVTFWYIVLAEGVLLPLCWQLLIFLMIMFGLCLCWLVGMFCLDHVAQAALSNSSNIGFKFDTAREVNYAVSSLSSLWNKNQDSIPPQLVSDLQPVISHLISLLQPGAAECPVYCLDLSSFSDVFFPPPLSFSLYHPAPSGYVISGSSVAADGGSCICDTARLTLVQPLLHKIWGEQLVWACLWLIAAVFGTSWLLMGLTASRERALCERLDATHNTTLGQSCTKRTHSAFIKIWRPCVAV
ncbi:hypothetical protein CEUSTIGMA_g554.t1 [Chlamydomonas eustigma]|uniref:Uncharacterized protein n=1 Tax=Chlamydomonas eustigma TaxID=1157962 RepID=A0A250WQM6_9CHLO|nr:hypothetical protein CEUSTIGMA_g554.t1 [Chlamydomonas eustigma]|eukprot:GAX73101.1 hypothetical protein CEUSTIGMA_g554.t1 [Chlamydomonas eustigma]